MADDTHCLTRGQVVLFAKKKGRGWRHKCPNKSRGLKMFWDAKTSFGLVRDFYRAIVQQR